MINILKSITRTGFPLIFAHTNVYPKAIPGTALNAKSVWNLISVSWNSGKFCVDETFKIFKKN